ncbi:hypothetical protein Tco_0151602 [Tanacetum coccineum]
MAQQQHAADVHPDELCPPNKRYDLMDANKKVDLENVQCPLESKILMNIITNHLTIFQHSQANDNNNALFVPPPSFLICSIYKQCFGFSMELKNVSNFKIPGLLQPWQTLCKIFSKCLTTRVTGWDQPPLQIMQMLYCFVNNIHVDYAELMWEGIYYSLHHPATSIPYLRFTKIIISHYMTIFPEISRRVRDAYHNLQDDELMKKYISIQEGKQKQGRERKPAWKITEEMKLRKHIRLYSIGPPNLSRRQQNQVSKTSTAIVLEYRQGNLYSNTTCTAKTEKADENDYYKDMNSTEEIEKLVEESENVDDSSPTRHDDTSIPDTRIEPMSDKEILEVEIVQEKDEETSKDTEEECRGVQDYHQFLTTRSPRNLSTLISPDTEKLQELTVTHSTPSSGSSVSNITKTNRLLFMPQKSSDQLANNLHDVMMETLPSLVKEKVTEQVQKEVPSQVRDQVPYLSWQKGLNNVKEND